MVHCNYNKDIFAELPEKRVVVNGRHAESIEHLGILRALPPDAVGRASLGAFMEMFLSLGSAENRGGQKKSKRRWGVNLNAMVSAGFLTKRKRRNRTVYGYTKKGLKLAIDYREKENALSV